MAPELTTTLAADLIAAIRAGDLPAAYRVITPLNPADMEAVALRAGLSVLVSKRLNERRAHIQRQIALATHNRQWRPLADLAKHSYS